MDSEINKMRSIDSGQIEPLLDEATASLDEAAEAALYRLLQERLKGTTIISIGHRSTLGAFHGRRIALTADKEFHQAREVTLVSAAE